MPECRPVNKEGLAKSAPETTFDRPFLIHDMSILSSKKHCLLHLFEFPRKLSDHTKTCKGASKKGKVGCFFAESHLVMLFKIKCQHL